MSMAAVGPVDLHGTSRSATKEIWLKGRPAYIGPARRQRHGNVLTCPAAARMGCRAGTLSTTS